MRVVAPARDYMPKRRKTRIDRLPMTACRSSLHSRDPLRPVVSLTVLAASVVCACILSACAVHNSVDGSAEPERQDAVRPLQSFFSEGSMEASAGDSTVPPSSDAHYNYLRGEVALNEEHYDEALTYFTRAAEVESGAAPSLRKRLAQLYLRAGKMREALEQVSKAEGGVGHSEKAELLQLKAGILAALGEADQAIETYRKVIDLTKGESEEPYVLLATLYAQRGELVTAKKTMQDLVKRKPSSMFGYYYLARVDEAAGDYAEAEKNYLRALELSPSSESIQLDYARVMVFQKRSAEALALLDKILEQNKNSIGARKLKSQILLQQNKLDDALKELEAVGSIEKDPIETRFKIALIKFERRDFAAAEAELSLILADKPGYAPARYYLASTYAASNRPQDALNELEKIPSGEKFYTEARMLAAVLLQQMGRQDEAVSGLRSAAEKGADASQILSLIASLQRDAGKLDQAIETLKQLVEKEPNDDKHRFALGVLYDEAKRPEEAMASMRKAIELNPKNANALNYIGYTLADRGGDLKEAERLIREALAIEPENGYFIDSLGWVYYQSGRYDKALKELQRAVKLAGDDAVIKEHLALAHQKNGQTKEALQAARDALTHAGSSDDKEVGARLEKLIAELEGKSAGERSGR